MFKNITHDCQYVFEWHTDIVCKESYEDDSGTACQIMFEAAKANVNLKPLHRPEGYTVKFNSKEYKINVCGPACSNQTGVCTTDDEDSYGMSSKSELTWDYDLLKLTYYGGSSCDGALSGQKTTSIFFECDMKAGYGKPVPHDLMQALHKCMALFTWKTNVTCIEGIYSGDVSSEAATVQPAVPGPSSSSETVTVQPTVSLLNDSSSQNSSAESYKNPEKDAPSATATALASVLIISGIVFVVVLVLFKSQRGQRILASARRLFGIQGYSNIGLHTENSTLLQTTSSSSRVFRVDESDDDLLRV